jgi:hypothetical protein
VNLLNCWKRKKYLWQLKNELPGGASHTVHCRGDTNKGHRMDVIGTPEVIYISLDFLTETGYVEEYVNISNPYVQYSGSFKF